MYLSSRTNTHPNAQPKRAGPVLVMESRGENEPSLCGQLQMMSLCYLLTTIPTSDTRKIHHWKGNGVHSLIPHLPRNAVEKFAPFFHDSAQARFKKNPITPLQFQHGERSKTTRLLAIKYLT